MKTLNFRRLFLTIVAAGLALSTMSVTAQTSKTTTTITTATAPQLGQGVAQILQLAQAKISDDTIIAYIRNSGNSYRLEAKQIIYLRQQGVSAKVINFMLNQTKVVSAPEQSATQPDSSYYSSAYYAQPYYYPYYGGYPYYAGLYPGVFSFGFRGGFHDGFRGGFHDGGGGFHGGGGGFHGGGGHR
jgi:hypothetical protein